MQASVQRETLLERRDQYGDEACTLWARLSLAQKFAASSLAQFGYDLVYIRHSHIGSLAILVCNGIPATISIEGEIDTSPNISIRH